MTASDTYQVALEDAGYRKITLLSFGDLIGGCRYVAIDEYGQVGQLTPRDPKSSWLYWYWSEFEAKLGEFYKRSDLLNSTTSGFEWFGKASEIIAGDLFYGPRKTCPMGFQEFITSEIQGYVNPFDVTSAFDNAHPTSEVERMKRELWRQRQELEAREAKVKLSENFAEAEELKMIGAQFSARGDTFTANKYFREAQELRSRIQDALDNRRPVVRENKIIEPVTSLSAWFDDLRDDEEERLVKPVRSGKRKPEIAEVRKRSIILED